MGENPRTQDTGTREAEEDYLASLQKALAGRVASLRIVAPEDGPMYLDVVSKASGRLRERVRAAEADGAWWFWWSWAERIGPADEPDAAAEAVLRVLGEAGARGRS